MKIKLNENGNAQGSVLVTAMMFCGILGILMGSYLTLVNAQSRSVARAQAWNRALMVAEAGAEEAMAHLNSGVGSWATNGWTMKTNGVFTKTMSIGDSSYFATIQTQPAVTTDPVILSTASVPVPLRSDKVSRTVVVQTRHSGESGSNAPGALVVSTFVNFKGFNVMTDSYNSKTNNQKYGSPQYTSNDAMDHGDVVTTSGNVNAVDIGNGKIKGTIHTGDNGEVGLNSGSVGDMTWVTAGFTGIEDGHHVQGADYTFPDATLPTGKIWLTPVPGNYKINGVTYKYLLNNTSPWKLATLDGGVYVNGPGVMLQVTSGFSLGSKDEIHIANNPVTGKPGDLSLYVTAADANIGGNGIVNETGFPSSFKYFGLPSNTSLEFGANAAFTGQIYAPQAAFTLGGGGKNTFDFAGRSITLSAKLNGHFNFHYDEDISTPDVNGPSGYTAISWDEPGVN